MKKSCNHGLKTLFNVPEMNVTNALNRLQGNRVLYMSLLKKFCHKYHDYGDQLHQWVQENKMNVVYEQCHALKGAAGNLELTALYQACVNLESALKLKNKESIECQIKLFEVTLDKIMHVLQPIVLHFKNDKAPEECKALYCDYLLPTSELFDTLCDELQEGSVGSEYYVTLLMERLKSQKAQKILREVSSLIEDYDFDDALKGLKKLRKII